MNTQWTTQVAFSNRKPSFGNRLTSRLSRLVFHPCVLVLCPAIASAQVNVFEQGATNFITELKLFALPFAILAVMAVGILAAVGRVSWGWPIGVVVGIALLFGAPQIVGWVRDIFVV